LIHRSLVSLVSLLFFTLSVSGQNVAEWEKKREVSQYSLSSTDSIDARLGRIDSPYGDNNGFSLRGGTTNPSNTDDGLGDLDEPVPIGDPGYFFLFAVIAYGIYLRRKQKIEN
jgi:hypothetical protein